MKTQKLMLTMAVVTTAVAACSKAQFGTGGGKRAGNDVHARNSLQNPEEEPLDLSKLEVNKPLSPNGPQGGRSEVLSKTIEMDCDTSAGIIVDVSEPGTQPGLEDASFVNLQGDDQGVEGPIDIGTDGKPTTPIDPTTPGKPGKPGKPGDNKPLPEQPPVELPDDNKVIAKVKGKFCPTAQSKLTVLFVVDYSGSMGRHVPAPGLPELPGYDPQINGSCGRLRAAEAIVAKINALAQASDDVRIGMVPFAGGIVTREVVRFVDHRTFAQHVNKDVFCKHVVQDPSYGYDPQNPGGIDGGGIFGIGGVDASTNYAAAFTAAETMLTAAYGRKVVYFISDGEPTSPGPTIDASIAAGIEAGRRLRANVDNLELNGLLLGNAGPHAQQTLEAVTGSPDRVRHAENADQLAAQILAFPEAAIDVATAAATLTVEPYHPRENLGILYIKRLGTAPVWEYETQPFVLLGKPGVEVENVVEVTALGVDGTTHNAVVKIRYRQRP